MTKLSTLLFERNVLNLNQIRLIFKARTLKITRLPPRDFDFRKRPIGNSGAFFCSSAFQLWRQPKELMQLADLQVAIQVHQFAYVDFGRDDTSSESAGS
jgi:hypothetical protein